MVLIELYLVFAITTALVSLLGVFWPVLREAKSKGISNLLVDSPVLASVIFFGVTVVLAPFVVSSLLFSAHAELFRLGLQRAVEKPDE